MCLYCTLLWVCRMCLSSVALLFCVYDGWMGEVARHCGGRHCVLRWSLGAVARQLQCCIVTSVGCTARTKTYFVARVGLLCVQRCRLLSHADHFNSASCMAVFCNETTIMLHLCIVPAAAAHTSSGSLLHACLFLLLNAWGCGVSGSVWLGQ